MSRDREGREYPRPVKQGDLPERYKTGRYTQEMPKAPVRAIKIKGEALREAIRGGGALDWADIHERLVDLWQEARLCIWRAKHHKAGDKVFDPEKGRDVQTYIADDRLVLSAIDTTRGILDTIIKIRREIGHDNTGIPRWAIERIERGLRDYPEAQRALLKELASEREKQAEVD